MLPALPGLPALVAPLDRGWAGDVPRQDATAPALVYSLGQLEEQLKRAYRTVTEGKFRWVSAGGCGGGGVGGGRDCGVVSTDRSDQHIWIRNTNGTENQCYTRVWSWWCVGVSRVCVWGGRGESGAELAGLTQVVSPSPHLTSPGPP